MNPGGSLTLSLRWTQIAVVERFSSVLYPMDPIELLRRLPHQGWVVSERTLRGVPETDKPVAAKGSNLELVINTENKLLGVRGLDLGGPENVAEAFTALREFWASDLDPSPGLETQYIEVTAQGWAKSGKNPVQVFERWWSSAVGLEKLGRLLDSTVSNFGVRLTPSGVDPNRPDWYDIRIEPLIVSSEKRYHVEIVWRDNRLEQVIHRLNRINDTTTKLIEEIEKG